MYTVYSPGAREITPGNKSLILTKSFTILIIYCKFQPSVFYTFSEKKIFQHFSYTNVGHKHDLAICKSKVSLQYSFKKDFKGIEPLML